MTIVITLLLFMVTKANDFGYVVKIDGDKVYLDITQTKSSLNAGDLFKVFTEGEELYNPVTKKSLGKITTNVAEGEITEISQTYAVGKITTKTAEVKTGFKVIWHKKTLPLPEPLPIEKPDIAKKSEIIWKSSPIDGIMKSLDLYEGKLIGVFDNEIRIYGLIKNELELLHHKELSHLFKPVSVSAYKFENSKNPFIFVTGYDKIADDIYTKVFETKSGDITEMQDLKWLVKSIKSSDGEKKLYTQQLFKTDGVKTSVIRELIYEKGKFAQGKKTKLTGLEWLYGFNIADLDAGGKPEVIYITSSDKIRFQKEKKRHRIDSADIYGRTPHFINLNGKTLFFYPRIPLYKNEYGEIFAYGIENKKKGGILARAMGLYEHGFLHRLKWTQTSFEDIGSVKLSGYVYDIARGRFADKEGIICPAITLDEKTVIEVLRY